MNRKSTVFDSKSEARAFHNLASRWEPKFSLYPQVPISKLIQIDAGEVTRGAYDYYLKTNVDYTLCRSDGSPVLSIEFDGLGGGFSRDGVYIEGRQTIDPHRSRKLNFKLGLAKRVGYPFFVVSDQEVAVLGREESLTIVGCIVGQILIRIEVQKRLSENPFDLTDMADDEIQDQVTDLEFTVESEVDPIIDKTRDYQAALLEAQFLRYYTPQVEHFFNPPLPNVSTILPSKRLNVEGIEARWSEMKRANRVGCRVILSTKRSTITKTIWVRNIDDFGVFPLTIAENIAKFLAYRDAYHLFKRG